MTQTSPHVREDATCTLEQLDEIWKQQANGHKEGKECKSLPDVTLNFSFFSNKY